jgi:localization factor PodJL
MAQSLPWSVKGIDADTREAAREAAHRAGMSVSDWLEHVIREEAKKRTDDETTARTASGGDVQARLRRLSQSGSGVAMERGKARSGQNADGIDALLRHAAQLEHRTRDSEARTTTALESIVGWIEKAEGRMAAAERASTERQERATSIIADAIKTVSSRVSDVERLAQGGLQRGPAAGATSFAPSSAAGAPRRPALSRDGLAEAISQIQGRQRQLAEPDQSSSMMQNLHADVGRIAGLQHPERRVGERRADVTPLMNGLRADLTQLRSEIASLSSAPASSRLEDSIRDLAQRLEQRSSLAPLDELARPLARIEAELSRLQTQDSAGLSGRIEAEIHRLGDRIEALAAMSHEPRLLAAAVHELSGLKDALSRGGNLPRFDELSSQIATLAVDIGRVREEIARGGPSNEVETAIDQMRADLMRETRDAQGIGQGLLQRILLQLDHVSNALGSLPATGMDEDDRKQLALLSTKLDQLAQRTQPESGELARRIEDIAFKLDSMSDRGSTEMIDRVERLSQQIDALSARGPAAIEKQIDMLAARIETLATNQQPVVLPDGTTRLDLSSIEEMIGDLARRIDEAARPDASAQGLEALERQIAALTERLDAKPAGTARTDGLETTLQDLMRYLGGLREETTTAVDRAARAAVADALNRAPGANSSADLSLLRHDLAGLKDVHVSIDQRTHSAIGAVNDTLEKIVQRLAQLEADIGREQTLAAPAALSRGRVAADAAPVRSSREADLSGFADERFARDARLDTSPAASSPPEPAPEPARGGGPGTMAASLREQMRQMPAAPQRKAPEQSHTFEPQPDAGPDLPLEPGSGRPRARSDEGSTQPAAASPPSPAAGSINPNLIAAARRAAMAASAESGALAADQGKALKGKGQKDGGARTSLPISLRETLEKRRKPILLGLAAIVLAIGAGQVATTLLGDPPQSAQVRPVAAPAVSDPATAPAQTGNERSESSQPATSTPPLPPKDQTSMSGGSPPAPGSATLAGSDGRGPTRPAIRTPDTTSSVRPAPVEVASLPPAGAATEPARISAAPGRVTDLGELVPTLGTPGLRKAALEGDASAVYELANRASEGTGMARDQKMALRLFERAAAAGSGPAQFRLGNMHEKGIGTARDPKLAMTWYRRAADKGNAKAMHNLAVLIAEGADGRPDYAAAADLFRKAAEFGVRDSQYNLAILLGRGLGVEQDLMQSYTWFAVAARDGDTDAAKKRDEVGAKLPAVDLAAGRTATLTWKPKTPDPVANEISAPADGWDPAPRPQRPPARPKAT